MPPKPAAIFFHGKAFCPANFTRDFNFTLPSSSRSLNIVVHFPFQLCKRDARLRFSLAHDSFFLILSVISSLQITSLFILFLHLCTHTLLTIALIASEFVYSSVGKPPGWYIVRLVYSPHFEAKVRCQRGESRKVRTIQESKKSI